MIFVYFAHFYKWALSKKLLISFFMISGNHDKLHVCSTRGVMVGYLYVSVVYDKLYSWSPFF